MPEQDIHSFDWDDTKLIRAYEKSMARRKNKENKNSSKPTDNKRRKWNVGDYCRALYSDELYYEAKIICMNGDFCTVEFLGYDETEDVDLLKLKESEGKRARKRQVKACNADSREQSSSLNESETGIDTTDGDVSNYSSPIRRRKQQLKPEANDVTYDTTMYENSYHQPNHVPATYYAPPMPNNVPFMPPSATMPPPPPMPLCPSLANDNTLVSMFTAWYMAGYYTGLYSAQKKNQDCQHCCSHSNQCCRH